MKRMTTHLLFLAGILLLAGVVCIFPPATPTPDQGDDTSMGTIQREKSLVQYGSSQANLQELTGTRPLLPGSALRVSNGGAARLLFDQGLELRAFNNTGLEVELEAVTSPFLYRLYLERSLVTGRFNGQDRPIVFDTPNGAQVYVYGTDFFVAYDPLTERTFAGNFSGSVELRHPTLPGGSVTVPQRNGYAVPGGSFSLRGDTYAGFQTLVAGLSDPLDTPRDYIDGGGTAPAPGNNGGSDVPDPDPIVIPQPPEPTQISLLFIYGGELDQPEVPQAMLQSVPWADLAAEMLAAEASIYLASVSTIDNPERADRFGFDQDAARNVFDEYFYMATPPRLYLLVPNFDDYVILMEAAGGYYEEFGFPVDMQVVPPGDFYGVLEALAAAGENVWALGPGP